MDEKARQKKAIEDLAKKSAKFHQELQQLQQRLVKANPKVPTHVTMQIAKEQFVMTKLAELELGLFHLGGVVHALCKKLAGTEQESSAQDSQPASDQAVN